MSRLKMDFKIIRSLHAVLATVLETRNGARIIVANTCKHGESIVVCRLNVVHRKVSERGNRLLLDKFGSSRCPRQVQMLGAYMFLQTGLGSECTTARAAAVPLRYADARFDFKGTADKLFLLGVDSTLVDEQVALFRETAATILIITHKVPTIVEVTMLNLHVCLQVAIGGANMIALIACGRVSSFDMLLHLSVSSKANSSVEDGRVETGIHLGHFRGAYLAPEAIATMLTVLVANEMC